MIQQAGLGTLLQNGLYKAPIHSYEEDFTDFDTTDTLPYNWTASGTGASVPTIASIKDEAFGVLRISSGTADDSYVSGLTAGEYIACADGKRILFKCRLNVTEATQADYHIGIMDTAATDIVGGIQDGFYFRKDDGDANWDFVYEAGATAVAKEAIHTAVNDTDVELAFEWLSIDASAGSGQYWVYVNGIPVDGANGAYVASGAPTALMGLGVVVQAGEGSQHHMDLDYWGYAVER